MTWITVFLYLPDFDSRLYVLESDVNLVVNKSDNNVPATALSPFHMTQVLIYQTGLAFLQNCINSQFFYDAISSTTVNYLRDGCDDIYCGLQKYLDKQYTLFHYQTCQNVPI
jgi:hypothetical protein